MRLYARSDYDELMQSAKRYNHIDNWLLFSHFSYPYDYPSDGFEDLPFVWRDKSYYVGGHSHFCDYRSYSIEMVFYISLFRATSH